MMFLHAFGIILFSLGYGGGVVLILSIMKFAFEEASTTQIRFRIYAFIASAVCIGIGHSLL